MVLNLFYYSGGAEEARTLYLLLAKQALSQVSYSPKNKLTYYSENHTINQYLILQIDLRDSP